MRTEILVLFGGAIRGAAQWGAYQRLHVEEGYRPDIILGSSIGAINGLMIAADRMDLLDQFWTQLAKDPQSLVTSPVINARGQIKLGQALRPRNWPWLLRHLTGKPLAAVGEASGLLRFLQQIPRSDLRARLCVEVCSLVDGGYEALWENDFRRDQDFHLGVLASASFPFLFPPVNSIELDQALGMGPIRSAVDSGLHQAGQLRTAVDIARGITNPRITIIAAHGLEPKAPWEMNHLGQILPRALDMILYHRFEKQLTGFITKNQIGPPEYERFPCRIIRPELRDVPEFFEATYDSIYQLYRAGSDAARDPVVLA